MTSKTLKELGLLGVLVLVLGAVVYRNMTAEPTVSAPPPSKPPARDTADTQAEPADGSVMDVKLELLAPRPDSYGAPQRDPFRFKPKPAPVVKPAPPPQQVIAIQQPVPRAPVPQPQGDSPERLIRYWGYVVTPAGKPVATLSYGLPNGPAAQVYGVEGDVIEGRYRLQRIEPDAIEVAELGGEGRRARISISRP